MSDVVGSIEARIAERSLLRHSFYTRWVSGTLPREAITEYAREYFRFENAFPRMLSAIHSQLDDLSDRQVVLDNLWDEEHGPDNHSELWLRFAEAVGASREDVLAAEPLPSTTALVDTYTRLAGSSPAEGLAALFAYERQVPDVAEAKITGLETHYGFDGEPGLDFWRVHGTLDREHAGAEADLLAKHGGPEAEAAADQALDAWWDFLSGVEAGWPA